jgi:Cd2+/Zn2+-exporting ATPase
MGIQDRYRITGMDCASCAQKIDTAVRRIDGVEDVSVSVSAGTMTVRRGEIADPAEPIRAIVTKLGYGIAPLANRTAPAASAHSRDHADHDHDASCSGHDHDHGSHDHDHAHDHAPATPAAAAKAAPPLDLHGHDLGEDEGAWWQSKKAKLTLAAGAAIVVAFVASHVFPEAKSIIFAVAMLVGLVPIARRALMAARYGTPFSIETLMTIAAVGAVIIGAGEEAAMVVFLFLIGELLEGVAARRARSSIRGLATLLPETARLEGVDGTREIPASELTLGAIIQIRPGDRIAADGRILEGESAIDEAPVTGESVPKRKGVGDTVFAGTINADGVIRVEVTAVASDNTIARIVRLVEEAQESKAPTERFIDRFSRWYTPAVLIAGALVAVLPPLFFGGNWDEWIYKGLAILLIGCPCALVISTPAAIAAGLAAGARQGLLMKGGAVLETLAGINRVAFDKTGTLTLGRPVVSDVVGYGRPEAEVIALAASLETGSNHPLARAILAKATDLAAPTVMAEAIAAIAGKGMTGKVGGLSLLLGSAAAAAEIVPLTTEQDRDQRLQRRGQERFGAAGQRRGRRNHRHARRPARRRQGGTGGAGGAECVADHADGRQCTRGPGGRRRSRHRGARRTAAAGQAAHHPRTAGQWREGGQGRRRHQRCAGAGGSQCRHRHGRRHRCGAGDGRCGDPQQQCGRRRPADPLGAADDGEHPPEHRHRAGPEGGVPGHDHPRHHRPLARHPR